MSDKISDSLKQLGHLFEPEDYVWVGNLYNEEENGEFFCINPVKGPESLAHSASRGKEDLTILRNFLFEFDSAPLNVQAEGIEKLKVAQVPLSSIVFSGSKSYHIIVSLSVPLSLNYESAWTALSTHIYALTQLKADEACKNPNRLSRLAGRTRLSTGVEQTLIELGPYTDNEYIQHLVDKYNIYNKSSNKPIITKAVNHDMTLSQFTSQLMLKPKLLNKILSVEAWAAPANMYPEILRLTLWAIDSTGVPEPVFTEYCNKTIFPVLLEAGYPGDKLDKGIKNAYNYKG